MSETKTVSDSSLEMIKPRSGVERRKYARQLTAAALGAGILFGAVIGYGIARTTDETKTLSEAVAPITRDPILRNDEIVSLKKQIEDLISADMGLVPLRLMRQRQFSFVPVFANKSNGGISYGTASYLGNGYFLTVKHGIMQFGAHKQPLDSLRIEYKGVEIPAVVVDAGNASEEVEKGDWAVIKVARGLDLPKLPVNLNFDFDFAEPIFRLGNDYSKGIAVTTGYLGRKLDNGLVTCLTDGHPGVSGGGILNRKGELVGIAVGRMNEDYRFSFIIPLQREMFKKIRGKS